MKTHKKSNQKNLKLKAQPKNKEKLFHSMRYLMLMTLKTKN